MWSVLLLVGLGEALQRSQGTYDRLLLLVLLVVLPWQCLRLNRPQAVADRWVMLGYALQSGLLLINPGFWFQQKHGGVALALGLNFLCALHAARQWHKNPETALKLGLLALFAARLLVPLESPQPYIDVFTIGTEGADRWLHGTNPYLEEYPDLYHGSSGYRAIYLYWPSGVWLQCLSRLTTGDIRYSFVACEAVVSWLLLGWFGPRNSKRGLLWVLFWLSCPASLVMLENAWIDTYLILFLVWAFSAWRSGRAVQMGLAIGWLLATKQYAPIFAGLMWLALLRHWPGRQTLKASLTALAMASALFLPFCWSGWPAFQRNTIQAVGELPLRKDGLTLQAFLLNEFQLRSPAWLMPTGYLISLGLLGLYCLRHPGPRTAWLALAAFLSVFCILGKQAFLNYYYLLYFFLWVLPFQDSMNGCHPPNE